MSECLGCNLQKILKYNKIQFLEIKFGDKFGRKYHTILLHYIQQLNSQAKCSAEDSFS